jgi:hypothetical protein
MSNLNIVQLADALKGNVCQPVAGASGAALDAPRSNEKIDSWVI